MIKIALIGTKGFNLSSHSFGGFETVITKLAPAFVRMGYDVTVYCRRKLYKEIELPEVIDGVQLRYLTSIETKNLGTMTNSLLAILDAIQRRTNIVFLFNLGLGIYIPLLKLFGIKVVTNLDGLEWERSKWSYLAKFVFKIGAKLNTLLSDKLIADAEEIKKIYVNKLNYEPCVIEYGAEIRTDLTPDSISNIYDLIPGQYYLLATRFIPENNALFVIENYIKSGISAKLVVLGRNYYNSEYERKIKSLTDPRVLFLGHIDDRKTLLEFYKYSYVYIHAHSVGGTNPSLLEAMANNSCILAHDNPFNKEMLNDWQYGSPFKLNSFDFLDKLLFMQTNPEYVKNMKEKSVERVASKYNWSIIEEKYKNLLNELI